MDSVDLIGNQYTNDDNYEHTHTHTRKFLSTLSISPTLMSDTKCTDIILHDPRDTHKRTCAYMPPQLVPVHTCDMCVYVCVCVSAVNAIYTGAVVQHRDFHNNCRRWLVATSSRQMLVRIFQQCKHIVKCGATHDGCQPVPCNVSMTSAGGGGIQETAGV